MKLELEKARGTEPPEAAVVAMADWSEIESPPQKRKLLRFAEERPSGFLVRHGALFGWVCETHRGMVVDVVTAEGREDVRPFDGFSEIGKKGGKRAGE